MGTSAETCTNGACEDHYHAHDPVFASGATQQQSQTQLVQQQSTASERQDSDLIIDPVKVNVDSKKEQGGVPAYDPNDHVFRRIIRNFTPSYVSIHSMLPPYRLTMLGLTRWFIITMSTGVISIMLHQLPYHAHWLNIISYIFLVLNLTLFLLFTFISILRYTLYPQIFAAVLRHPHQSLFIACFPVGLGTLINMMVLVCAPAWGHGWATFAWVLWWIDSVLALATCFHLTFVM